MTDRQKSRVLSGVEVVTIPLQDYADLLDSKRQLVERSLDQCQINLSGRSIVDRNPEVAIFLAQRFGLAPVRTILRDCRKTFGSDRTPSLSAAYRYWERLRKDSRP